MRTRNVDWRVMATLGCLTLLGACTKAEYDEPDSGSGGTGSGGGGLIGGSGGAGTGGSGGESPDVGPDEDVSDGGSGEPDMVADVPVDMGGGDAEVAMEVAPEAPPTDGPMGIMPTLLGQILISEVMNDSAVLNDDFGEWFEVFNPSADTNFDLNGCTLADSNNVVMINKPLVLTPGSFHTLALSTMAFVPDFVYMGVKLDNQLPDSMTISCNNTMIDKFIYDPRLGMSGHAFSVDPTHLRVGENNVVGNFCVSNVPFHVVGGVSDFGTPNMPNPPCPAGRF